MLTILVCWLLLLSVGVCQEAVLTPSEYVAYEGQPEFTFQCTVTGPGVLAFVVRVDGLQGSEFLIERGITISAPMQLGNTTSYQQNIIISATQLNEDTTIECFGLVSSSGFTNTAMGTFKVQGLLDPPTITEPVEHSTAHLILTWTPPCTLDITDLDPDITYRVCNNDTSTCVDTTDTSYIFPTTCFLVEYSVSACNPVGCSENATIISLPLPVFIQVVVYVQAIELDGRGGNVNVTCVFASGSIGCRVTIVGEGGSLQQMEATRKDESHISASVIFTGLTNGTFLVAAGDIEADGSFDTGRQPASQFYTVTDAPPPSPITTESSAASSPKPTGSPVLLSPATEDDGNDAISVGVTVGVVGSMLLVTAIVVVVVIITAVCVVRRSKNTGGIEMRENASYEMVVTRQQQQGVHRMERCPAYEVARRQD